MKKLVLASMVALSVVGATWAQNDGTMMKSDQSGSADGTMMKSDPMMVSDADRTMSADPMDLTTFNVAGLGKNVMAFSTEKAAWTLAKSQTVVYFFAATWCPDCQSTYKDLKANFSLLPSNLTLVFVNYDKAKDLKVKYGITAQHTFVVIGASGEKKKVFSGTNTVADIVKTATSM